MRERSNTPRIVVYLLIGVVLLAALVAAAVYLPGFVQAMHGG